MTSSTPVPPNDDREPNPEQEPDSPNDDPDQGLVISHAPPQGIGDRQADTYHAGYDGYRWLLERSDPRLWLHGHVPPASVEGWRVVHDGTDVVNVTGAVLVEIQPPGATTTKRLSAA